MTESISDSFPSWAARIGDNQAELRYSILGSRLRLTAHGSGGREQLILDSENPGVFSPMLQAFRVLLPSLANPVQSRYEP